MSRRRTSLFAYAVTNIYDTSHSGSVDSETCQAPKEQITPPIKEIRVAYEL
jgi:hypothetical protein